MPEQDETMVIRDINPTPSDIQKFGSNSAAILKIVNDLDQDISVEIRTTTFEDAGVLKPVSYKTKTVPVGSIGYLSIVGAWSFAQAIVTAAGIPTIGEAVLAWDFKPNPVDPDVLTESDKGVPDGVCPLDGSAKISLIYIPSSVLDHMDFKGPWDASGGTMPVSPDNGDTYKISVAGTLPVVGYAEVGDLLIYDSGTAAWTLYQTNMTIGALAGYVQENGADLAASGIVETNALKKFITAVKNTAYNKNFGSGSGEVAEGSYVSTPLIVERWTDGTFGNDTTGKGTSQEPFASVGTALSDLPSATYGSTIHAQHITGESFSVNRYGINIIGGQKLVLGTVTLDEPTMGRAYFKDCEITELDVSTGGTAAPNDRRIYFEGGEINAYTSDANGEANLKLIMNGTTIPDTLVPTFLALADDRKAFGWITALSKTGDHGMQRLNLTKPSRKLTVSGDGGSPDNVEGSESAPFQNIQEAYDYGVLLGWSAFEIVIDTSDNNVGTLTLDNTAKPYVALTGKQQQWTNNLNIFTTNAGSSTDHSLFLDNIYVDQLTLADNIKIYALVHNSYIDEGGITKSAVGTYFYLEMTGLMCNDYSVLKTFIDEEYGYFLEDIWGDAKLGVVGAPDPVDDEHLTPKKFVEAFFDTSTGHRHDGIESRKVTGSNVINTPAGSIAATNVQAALNELDTEKEPVFSKNGAFNKDFAGSGSATTVSKSDHTHATYQLLSQKDAANGYPGLDAGGLLNPSQLPPLAITDTFVVASEVAQLALTVQKGDVAVRSDENKSYINVTGNNVSMADWQLLLTPTDAVLSVFSRTGVVTSQNGDYIAGQVTNVPAGTIAAVTVQAAIDELDTEKATQADINTSIVTHTAIAGAHHARPVQATESVVGIAEIATQAETDTGTDDTRIVTPKKLAAALPVFGTEYDSDESEGVSNTSLTAYQEKLKLTTGVLPAGDYRIGWSCEVANSAKDKMVEFRVEVDDTTTIAEVRKPKVDANTEYIPMSGMKDITLTNAAHDIDIDYRALSDTAYIRRARIEIWRVA